MKQKTNFSATELLEARNSFLDAIMLFKLLEKIGYLYKVEYLSSTGTGEIKTYKSLTEKGLKYGINRGTRHPPKTECRFFEETFDELLAEVLKLVKYDHC
ncbi:hypothetical protein [Trichlorobacter lovleyi]|uniref:hypothetical protein n=1 Tax=Trichlorobacter lovleyi TaxID=313985 RepID=UPI003D0FB7AE